MKQNIHCSIGGLTHSLWKVHSRETERTDLDVVPAKRKRISPGLDVRDVRAGMRRTVQRVEHLVVRFLGDGVRRRFLITYTGTKDGLTVKGWGGPSGLDRPEEGDGGDRGRRCG